MEINGHTFLDKVLGIVKEEAADDAPLIQFKHPKELEVRVEEINDHFINKLTNKNFHFFTKA